MKSKTDYKTKMIEMELQEIFTFVVNNGFAIVVAFYSLTRLEKTVKANTDATNRLYEAVSQCPKK